MPKITRKRLFQALFGVFVAITLFCFFYFDLNEHLTEEQIGVVRNYLLQFGWWTPVIIVLLYIVFNLAGLPTLFFSVLSGYLYGVYPGFFLAWGGMTIGLFSSFMAGRYLFQDHFVKKYGGTKVVRQLEKMLDKYHLWAVIFTRITMLFPYNLLNYAYSIMKIRTSTYLIGSAVGIIIPTVILTYTGELLTKGVELLGMIY
ncbi:MAG: TVP38/TMEM64 family protein [Flammeovirgaceae bacterium]